MRISLKEIFKPKSVMTEKQAFLPPERQFPREQHALIVHAPDTKNLVISNLVVHSTDGTGKVLVDFGSFTFRPGDRVLIEGPSGSGKSTLLRVIKDPNLWEFGSSGTITKPENSREMFVPSSDYMPNLTLREIVCGQTPTGDYTTQQVAEALTKAGLGHIVRDLDDQAKKRNHWRHLSDGQKKRLSVAGILLRKPAILELDEITSSLDPRSEKDIYDLLLKELPQTIILSIVHREGIRDMHNISIQVSNGQASCRHVTAHTERIPKAILKNTPDP